MKNTSNSCLDSVFADISKMLCSCGVRLLLTSDDVYDADVNALVNLGAISIVRLVYLH